MDFYYLFSRRRKLWSQWTITENIWVGCCEFATRLIKKIHRVGGGSFHGNEEDFVGPTVFFEEMNRPSKKGEFLCSWIQIRLISSFQKTFFRFMYNSWVTTNRTRWNNPFHMVCKKGQFDVVNLPIQGLSINWNAQYVNGMTHFDFAAHERLLEHCKIRLFDWFSTTVKNKTQIVH